MSKLVDLFPEKDAYIGGDSFLLNSWNIGMNSAIGLSFNICPQLAKMVFEAYKNKNQQLAKYYQKRVREVENYYKNSD